MACAALRAAPTRPPLLTRTAHAHRRTRPASWRVCTRPRARWAPCTRSSRARTPAYGRRWMRCWRSLRPWGAWSACSSAWGRPRAGARRRRARERRRAQVGPRAGRQPPAACCLLAARCGQLLAAGAGRWRPGCRLQACVACAWGLCSGHTHACLAHTCCPFMRHSQTRSCWGHGSWSTAAAVRPAARRPLQPPRSLATCSNWSATFQVRQACHARAGGHAAGCNARIAVRTRSSCASPCTQCLTRLLTPQLCPGRAIQDLAWTAWCRTCGWALAEPSASPTPR